MANPYYSAVDVALLGQVNNVLDTALLPGVPTQRGASGIITVVPPLLNLGNATNAQLSLDTAALPVSTATQTALNLKLDSTTAASTYAPLASPTLTGTVNATDLILAGNLTVNGTQTILNTTNLAVTDSVIYLSDNQYTTDALDIGFYGAYGTTGGDISNHKHTGLIRNHVNGVWTLFSNGTEPSGQTVDLTSVNYDTLLAGSFKVNGGTSSQFLKADGTLDSTSYQTAGSYLTTSAAASTYASLSGNNSFTGSQTLAPSTTNAVALTITPNGTGNQITGSNFSVTSAGTLRAPILTSQSAGQALLYTGAEVGAIRIDANSPSNKNLVLRGAASQTADLIQTQTLAGTVLGGTNAAGQIYTGATTAGLGFANATTSASAASTIAATYVYAATSQLVQPGVLVTTNNFQPTYFNGTFAVTSVATVSAGSSYSFTVVGSGFTASGTSTTQGTWALPNQMTIVPAADAVRGLVVKQYSSNQNGDLQQWQNAAGTALASVNQTGVATFPSVISSGNLITGTSTPYGRLTVFPASTQIGAVIRGAASQTANVQEWQDSNAALLAAVRSDGKLKFATANTATTVGAAGSASVLPAIPVGYIQIDVNGTLYKLPYYNN